MDLTAAVEFVLVGGLLLAAIFGLLHLRPLTHDEILELSCKRRAKKIREYFTYVYSVVSVDKEFKAKMSPDGRFHGVNDPLWGFPSKAAALMKGKKHEWVICAFERGRSVQLMWLNKGVKAEVSIKLLVSQIARIALEGHYDSVLRFHNHPNSNPDQFDLLRPSSQDIVSAKYYAAELNVFGINFVDFVCERGRYQEYSISPAADFIPIEIISRSVEELNGVSKARNLQLHIERIF